MSPETLLRRSRFRRTPAGKRVEVTTRDIAILQWLYRYRYLSRDHLIAAIGPRSQKRFIERLGDLFHETGFIARRVPAADPFSARATQAIYEIAAKGIEYLEQLEMLPNRAVTFSRQTKRSYNPQALHTMAIIDALLAIELDTATTPQQRFVPVDEILARAPVETRSVRNPLSVPVTIYPSEEHPIVRSRIETHLIPDALYGIEYLIDGVKRYRFWALECERTSPAKRATTKASSTALKRAAYDALIQSGAFKRHWGIPNLNLRICRNAC